MPFGSAGVAGEVVVLEHTETDAGVRLDDRAEDFYGRSSACDAHSNRVIDIVIQYAKALAEFRAQRFHNFGLSHEAVQAQSHHDEDVLIGNTGRGEFFQDKR